MLWQRSYGNRVGFTALTMLPDSSETYPRDLSKSGDAETPGKVTYLTLATGSIRRRTVTFLGVRDQGRVSRGVVGSQVGEQRWRSAH